MQCDDMSISNLNTEQMQQIYQKFSKGIVTDDGSKVVNIYKNFLRDIRMYLTDPFNAFKEDKYGQHKNRIVNNAVFPLVIREFVKSFFDQDIIEMFRDMKQFSNKMLYFVFACFILPKQVMQVLEVNKCEVIHRINNDIR